MESALVRSGREAAEQRAREAGYAGIWPPPPKPRVDAPEDMHNIVDQLFAGDHRANLLWQVAVHAAEFFDALSPEQCGALARKLIDLAEDAETPRRVRIRAIQAAIRPLIQLTHRARKLERVPAGDKTILGRLEANIAAFVGALGTRSPDSEQPAPLIRLASILFTIGSQTTGPKGREDQVRAITIAMDLITHMMDAIINVRGELVAESGREPGVVPKEQIERAQEQFAALQDEARRRLKAGDQKGEHDELAGGSRNIDD